MYLIPSTFGIEIKAYEVLYRSTSNSGTKLMLTVEDEKINNFIKQKFSNLDVPIYDYQIKIFIVKYFLSQCNLALRILQNTCEMVASLFSQHSVSGLLVSQRIPSPGTCLLMAPTDSESHCHLCLMHKFYKWDESQASIVSLANSY